MKNPWHGSTRLTTDASRCCTRSGVQCHLEARVSTAVAKFADNTQLFRLGETRENTEELQRDLIKPDELATWWEVMLSVDHCNVMHTEGGRGKSSYSVQGSKLTVSTREMGLDVTAQWDLLHSVCSWWKTANKMAGCIRSQMQHAMENILMSLKICGLQILCVVLGTPFPKGYCITRGGSETGEENGQGPGRTLIWEEVCYHFTLERRKIKEDKYIK